MRHRTTGNDDGIERIARAWPVAHVALHERDSGTHRRLSAIACLSRLTEHLYRRIHANDLGPGEGSGEWKGEPARAARQLQHATRAVAREQASEELDVFIGGALVLHGVEVGPRVICLTGSGPSDRFAR